MDCEVLVVGAGPAGLTAARDLRRAGRQVMVVQARHRVGGRTLNADIGNGHAVEVGGQWVGPQQSALQWSSRRRCAASRRTAAAQHVLGRDSHE